MHYATYYPNEETLVFIQHFKCHEPKLLDSAAPVSQDQAYKIARFRWKEKAILIKKTPMDQELFAKTQEPKPAPKPIISDEDFLKGFPKGMHAAMRSTAKRHKTTIQDIFLSSEKSDGSWTVRLNDAWFVDTGERPMLVWLCTVGAPSINECLPYFKLIARNED